MIILLFNDGCPVIGGLSDSIFQTTIKEKNIHLFSQYQMREIVMYVMEPHCQIQLAFQIYLGENNTLQAVIF